MEACATRHPRGRVALAHGHDVQPFVKRRKNGFADAAAIAAAAFRPGMSCVAVKSAGKQGRAVAFRTHPCFVPVTAMRDASPMQIWTRANARGPRADTGPAQPTPCRLLWPVRSPVMRHWSARQSMSGGDPVQPVQNAWVS